MTSCPLPPLTRVWAYLRHSPGEEQTIDHQRAAVERYCDENNLILTRTFTDEARTGTTTAGRDAFNAMIDRSYAKPREADAILVWSWRRFARDFDDAQFFRASLRRNGWRFASISDVIPEGPIGRLIEAVYDFQADDESRRIGIEARSGQQALAQQGFIPGGRPPRGYTVELIPLGAKPSGKPRYGRKWVPNPELAEAARRAWELRAAGASYRELSEAVGLYRDSSSWSAFFANTAYKGIVTYGGTEIQIPPLVDDGTWEKVQAMRREHAAKSRPGACWQSTFNHPRRRGHDHLLSGLVFCGRCGSPMNIQRTRKQTLWLCSRRKRKHDCDAPQVSEKRLERFVLEKLSEDLLAPRNVEPLLEAINERLAEGLVEERAELERLAHRIAELDRAIGRLLDAVEEVGPTSLTRERLIERERERAGLVERRDRLEAALEEAERPMMTASELEGILGDWGAILKRGSRDERRRVVRELIERIEVGEGKVRVWYRMSIGRLPLGAQSIDYGFTA